MKNVCLIAGVFFAQTVFSQLTIFSEPGQAGTSANCTVSTIFKGASIPGGLNDQVSSIFLQKNFIATLAENEDGTGDSYTFVAAVSDISVDLSRFLNNKVSFIRVLPFRQTKKKGVGNTLNEWIAPINVDWFYDWGALDVSLPSREYAMQAWGRQAANNPANIANYIAKPDVTHLLSFNEPDNTGQANISVTDAVPLHRLLAATGLRLGSPAPTESEAFVWLREFMAGTRAQNIKVDHIVIHWYDWGNWNATGNTAPSPTSVFNRFKAYVERVYSIYGKPIWIKEFNANRNTTSATHEGFIAQALPWMEQQPYIERYAYFFPPALPPVDISGNVTNIGKAYRDFNASTVAITKNIDNTELLTDHLNTKLEAETFATRLGSNVTNCAQASGGQMAAAVSGGTNRIAFHNVVVPQSGTYNMTVSYYTTTNRTLALRINHAAAQTVSVPAHGPQWCFEGGSPGTLVIPVNLLAGTNTIEFTDCPIIDYIQVASQGTLPVTLLDFRGTVQAKAIELTWKTAQESNSGHFEILKSTDGVLFEPMGRVDAAGNSTVEKTYRFVDHSPAVGQNFYKLKQLDRDGSFTHSKSILLNYNARVEGLRLIAATASDILLALQHNTREQATLRLVDIDGKILHQQRVDLQEGMNQIQVGAGLPRARMGIVSLQTATGMQTIKVLR